MLVKISPSLWFKFLNAFTDRLGGFSLGRLINLFELKYNF